MSGASDLAGSFFLGLEGRTILVFGVANKKSVAFHVASVLEEQGAKLIYSVRSEARAESLRKLRPEAEIHVCDVEHEGAVAKLFEALRARHDVVHGILHSIAFADFEGFTTFDQVSRKAFLQAMQVSCHSFIEITGVMKPILADGASLVTISISTTKMAAENYGFMAPVKAALESSVVFLAKALAERGVRVNSVAPGLLKTSASAGIPGYVDSWLYAEKATLRKRGLETREVANAAAFLLSPRSSGINAQNLVIDAGMGVNYFDRELVKKVNA